MILPSDFFIAGGTLRAQAPSYVTRPADQELFEHTLAGEFCYVLTPRQMGKSSLIIRTVRRLAEAGCMVANLDLTGIGSGTADQWYLGLLTQISRELQLSVDVPNWWQERASLAIPQRFSEFLRDVVLQQVTESVVIFIDEIDSTLNLDFRDDFFAAIRAIYNARATESAYKRLTFALLGVATPTDLIKDRERTPFNIGRRIVLQEFSYDEAESLKIGLEACHPGQGDVILRRIFEWTNGYPYLTQKLCLAAAERSAADWDAVQVDELVETTFFSDTGRKDPNFKFVQQRIQESEIAVRRQMLNLYRKVYNGKSVPDDDRSQSQNYLELYGLVRVDSGRLNVRNDIYRRIFDQKWIEAHMPANRDLRLAIGASLVALIAIVAVALRILQTPSPSTSLYAKQFNDNAFPTARIEALAGLFNLQNGLYDRDDEQGLSLFYNLGPYDQLDLFSQANARARGREMVTAIRRISLTLDEQDPNDLAIMGEMITALGAAGQPGSDALIKELTTWKSGRELAEKGQYQDATTAYSNTIRLDPDNLAARYDRASAFIKLARYGEALADLNQIIVIAKTAAPPPTAVPTATITPTSALNVTGAPLVASAVGIPNETALSSTAVPTITATSVITPTPEVDNSKSRFISTELIISTVADTIRGNEELLSFLRVPQNQTIANQDLIAILGLSSIVQQSTNTPVTPPQPAGCSELIVNGGFESQTGWTEVSKAQAAIIAPELPHTGKRSAWLGGTDQETQQYIFQEVRLPANASSAKLTYYRQLHKETTGLLGASAGEAQFSTVFANTNGDVVAEVEKLSSRQSDDKWQQVQFDVLRLGGKSLRLSFAAENPRGNVSSMFVDDVSLIACTTGNGPAAPPAAATNSVYIAGTINDADTGRGVEGAQVFVINPGLSATQAVADDTITRDEVIATGTTDAKGYYQSDQAIPIGQTNNLCIVGPGGINLMLYNLDSNGRFGPIPSDIRQLYINEGQRTLITVVSDASQLPVTTIGGNQLLPEPGQYYKAVISKIG